MRGLLDLDQPHTFHFLPDAARGFAALVEDERADGAAWVLPAAPPTTQRQVLQLINRALPTPVRIGRATPTMLRIGGLVDAMIRETRSTAPQWQRPWVVDASRFVATFGQVETTPHEVALPRTVAWFREHAGR